MLVCTNRRLRVNRPAGDIDVLDRVSRCFSLAVVPPLALVMLCTSSLSADTIFLRDGTQILDCKVTLETATVVHVRTPVGDMQVPRTQILRIQRVKTVYDRYAEQLARIREGDVNGLVKLAVWCRNNGDLRKESDELLEKVISLKEDHASARRLLGHVKVGENWVIPEPLALQLVVNGVNADDVRAALEAFLKTRNDVRLLPVGATVADSEDVEPLAICALHVSVVITRKAAGTVYGIPVGTPVLGASVRIDARSEWLGKTKPRAAAEGQVPANGGNPRTAVQNALGSSSTILHKFLDHLVEFRSKKLLVELRKKERERKLAERAKRRE